MVSDNSPYGLLIVSASDKFAESIREITAHYRFEGFRTVATCGEARRCLMEGNFDALIVNTPAGDEFGCDFATDMALNTNVGVLLLVRNATDKFFVNRYTIATRTSASALSAISEDEDAVDT